MLIVAAIDNVASSTTNRTAIYLVVRRMALELEIEEFAGPIDRAKRQSQQDCRERCPTPIEAPSPPRRTRILRTPGGGAIDDEFRRVGQGKNAEQGRRQSHNLPDAAEGADHAEIDELYPEGGEKLTHGAQRTQEA